MKLYATTTSERASKGQGGNERLEIQILGENKEDLGYIKIIPDGTNYRVQHAFKGQPAERFWIEKGTPTNYTKHCTDCGACNVSYEPNVYGWENGLCDDCHDKQKGKKQ